jgi:hypothetical protein
MNLKNRNLLGFFAGATSAYERWDAFWSLFLSIVTLELAEGRARGRVRIFLFSLDDVAKDRRAADDAESVRKPIDETGSLTVLIVLIVALVIEAMPPS